MEKTRPIIDKQDVILFFDRAAATWDSEMICPVPVIDKILDGAHLRHGMDVLDVACGTGVLFPFYMSRGVKSVTAIDIAPAMAKIAGEKVQDSPITVICGDAETYDFGRQFDCAIIYNAFPHFADPDNMIRSLAEWIRPGGTLTVAHGMSAEALRLHHSGSASRISLALPEPEELANLFAPWFDVTLTVSNDEMYQVTGVRRT
ncbi:MAG: class I SAM-dependent methyltransferase [Eubacteriales bacterium]|nr:class I SAM-dependent methyltransferase [Eubacteriales bacterium]